MLLFISSRGRSLRRRTLQDLIARDASSFVVRVGLGLRFFGSFESLQQFKSVVSFRELVQLELKSLVSLREFQSNEALGVVLECLDNGVFEIS